MCPFLRWKEFGKSCKYGDKSNYLTPAAAGTVGGNILGVESAPCSFANSRSVAASEPHSAASNIAPRYSDPQTICFM